MEKKYYIVNDYKSGDVCEPIIVYEDGSLEIESVIKFKKHHLIKQWYDHIHYNIIELRISKTDLRKDFYPRLYGQSFADFFQKLSWERKLDKSDKISMEEIYNFWYKEEIEKCIGAIEVFIDKRIKIREARAIGKKDIEFLKRIGSRRISWVKIS